MPYFLPAAGEEMGFFVLDGRLERVVIGVSQHQDLPGVYILNNRRNQAAIVEFQMLYSDWRSL